MLIEPKITDMSFFLNAKKEFVKLMNVYWKKPTTVFLLGLKLAALDEKEFKKNHFRVKQDSEKNPRYVISEEFLNSENTKLNQQLLTLITQNLINMFTDSYQNTLQ